LGYDPFAAQPGTPAVKAPEDLTANGCFWAARLISSRKARGLTQTQLARKLQIDPSTLANGSGENESQLELS
jgi:hypothetical protein